MKHLTLVATVLFFANSALAQMGTPLYSLQEKMERFEHDLILLQQRVYKGHIISDDKETTVSNEQADDLLNKIMAQESALNELTQKVEQLTHELSQTKEHLSKMNADIEMRFKLLEQDKTSKNESTASQKTTADAPKKTPQEQYDEAYNLLREGKHVAAEKAFLDFIKNNPSHDLAGNANYWLGETYYARGQYEQAAPIFAEGFTTYKKNSKAPDNLLKLGLTMNKLGKKEEACSAFTALPDEFPKANATTLTRAKDEAKKLACPQ